MGTVKASGSLSLEDDVLPNLPAAAPSDGGATIGSNAVSMSDFYESVAGGAPASGTISFSDIYSVDNTYSVSNFGYSTAHNTLADVGKDGTQFYRSTSKTTYITGRIGYRYGNRSTSTGYTISWSTAIPPSKNQQTGYRSTSGSASRRTNTLAFHYNTYNV